jgi:hypothetical protein
MPDIPYQLRNAYNSGRLIPFIGAGVSMSVKWTDPGPPSHERRGPSWAELVNKAALDLGITDASLLRARGTDLQILEYYRIKNHGAAKLTNWLTRNMQPPESVLEASPIHRELAALENVNLVYTTNYDDFLERSFTIFSRKHRVVAVEADMVSSDVCEIVKFHGDLNHPDAMVLSEFDYERRLSFSTPMDFRLRADLLNRALLFIGYSFRDYNVSYLFSLMNDTLARAHGAMSGRRAYITVSDPSDFEFELFSARNIEVIPINGARMTDDIAEMLANLRS